MLRRVGVPLVLGLALGGCTRDEKLEESTFYSRKVGPVLQESCSISPTRSGCHISDGQGNAFGNLSFESYDTLDKRRDLLVDYGPYGVPGLLLKVVPNYQIGLTHWVRTPPLIITTRIAHAAQTQVDFTSSTYTTLNNWIERGAQENNAPPAEPTRPLFDCSPVLGENPLFDPSTDPATPDFATFRASAGLVLAQNCAASNCHGSLANNLHLTCGQTPEQVRWNYFAAGDYISEDTSSSEILRRALARDAGGTFHEGGTVFPSRDDFGYVQLEAWAALKMRPTNIPTDAGFPFFTDRVQPMLVKRGCMMLGCHSSSMFHDFRLRGGSGGHFGLPSTRTNYRLTLDQLALEHTTVHSSRLVRKNLAPEAGGIRHRGGPLFGVGDQTTPCDPVAAETGPIDEQSPFCVISRWFEIERAARLPNAPALASIVFVRRPPVSGAETPQDYATYQPGAEVVQLSVTVGADGSLAPGVENSLSTLCGLDSAITDARRPAVSWDGTRIAFSARASATDPLHVYVVQNGMCMRDAEIDAPPIDDAGMQLPAGELVHNFDPTFAPDGRIVFVSTRGNITNVGAIGYSGPRRAPADPTKLNANLYVREANGRIRQLTFLLNQELLPSFMHDGRVIFTNEKRAPGFYQLAGRRINLDGGDYHPLFGQRSTVDHNQATGVVELADKNLAMIMSDRGAQHGAGALAVVNRSVGVNETSVDTADYLVDASLLGRPPGGFFQPSLVILDPAATGKLDATVGAYRNPSPLPDGRILVAYAPTVQSLGAFTGKFELVVVDSVTGMRTPLVADATRDLVWPVAVYAKANLGIFESRHDEANGATGITSGSSAEVMILDLGVLQSLLFQNTRGIGREVGSSRYLGVWEDLPPEPGVTDFASGGGFVTDDDFGQLYVRRQFLGSVPVQSDGSAKMSIPGGVPIVLETDVKLAADRAPTRHSQRESMQFYPGERARQGFRRNLFDGICAGCHGSLSGAEMDGAVEPDILTRASDVAARTASPTNLTSRSGSPEGPPFP